MMILEKERERETERMNRIEYIELIQKENCYRWSCPWFWLEKVFNENQ
jgi:hypothetical protein